MSLPPLVWCSDSSASPDAPPPRPPGSACYECLGVPELFDMILREVLSEGDGKGSLASVASTSKALYSGAIAVLWEDMERLDPFLDLIPEKVWDYVRGEREPERAWRRVFHRNKSILHRIQWYGQHIKRVAWCLEEGRGLSHESTVGLLMHLPGHIQLFPNVRSFAWTEHGPSDSPSLLNSRLFAHSGLQELVLNMDLADWHPLADVLDVLTKQCPRLATLQLVGNVDTPLDVAVSAALAGLIHHGDLAHFTCTCPLFDEVLLAVAQSTSLKYVDIKMSWYTLDSMVVCLLPKQCFPSVQDLSLHFEVLDTSSLALLRRLTSGTIVKLSLHVMSEVYDDDLLIEHLDALAEAPFAPTLRTIELHAWRTETLSDEDNSNPCPVTLNTLRPLLGLKQLTHFIVHAKSFSLASRDIRAIALAFPHLDTLELMPSLALGTEPPADALLHLAELCPHLAVVALPITTTFGVPGFEEGWASKSRVTTYTIVTSQDLSGDPRLSSYISALFPASLPEMYAASDASGEFEETYVDELKRGQTSGASSACSRAQS